MRKTIFLIFAAFAFASCGNDDEMNVSSSLEWDGEIRLTTTLIRAFSELETGKEVAIYVNNSYDDSPLYNKTIFTVDAEGNLLKTGNTELKYPESGNIDIYGLTELTGGLSGDFHSDWIQAQKLAIENNNIKDYAFAKIENQSKSSSILTLQFKHILSKIKVAIAKGIGGTADMSISKFSSALRSGTINLPTLKEDLSNEDGFTSIENKLNDNFSAAINYYEAYVLPQNINTDVALFKVTIDGKEYSFSSTVNFQSGKEYTYHLSVDISTSSLIINSVNISDWEQQTNLEGSISVLNE